MNDKYLNNTNKNNITNPLKYDLSFQKINQTPITEPLGFGVSIIEGIDNRSKKLEVAKTKTNKAKELAYGQGKAIFMSLFSLYFIGSNLSRTQR